MSVYDPGPDFEQGSYEYMGFYDGRDHAGIDFVAPEGTPIPAAATGTVVGKGEEPTYGNMVILRHSGPTEPPYRYTLYAHMTPDIPVSAGTLVPRGTPIGYVSSTGNGGNGVNHLHFELLHLEVTWESLWKSFSRWVEYWRTDVALMLENPEGRVNPLDDLNWSGVDVYFPPPRPRRGGGGRRSAAMPF